MDYGPGTIGTLFGGCSSALEPCLKLVFLADDHDTLNVTVAREGKFELCGLDSEVSGLELVLRIRHNCSNRVR